MFKSILVFLYQADGSLSSLDSIITRMKIAVMRHGVRGIIIDPYNYIARDQDTSETDWISEMLTKLRVFAQAHSIHIWFVAHPTKMMRKMTAQYHHLKDMIFLEVHHGLQS